MFIQTQATPNPNALKFLPGREVVSGEPHNFTTKEAAEISPLASALFEIDGVSSVFLGSDFISITNEISDWSNIKPIILGTIMDHFLSDAPVLNITESSKNSVPEEEAEFFDEKDSETVEVIKELLDSRVRPAVAMDGGDITFRGFRDGVVFLSMKGACAGCPSSSATLKSGVENLLRHFIPNIDSVQQI
ncbi:MAG: NifU family protein [Devosiaceae bacterium]|nr:NifU family protein [Devosiaceae bacterium]